MELFFMTSNTEKLLNTINELKKKIYELEKKCFT